MIYIITHKKVHMPELAGYHILQVGAAIHENLGYLRDDFGDNISQKNPNYCELTDLYWIWKNCSDEYKGLTHYRRYFGKSNIRKSVSTIYTYEEMKGFLHTVDIVLPYIENLKQNAKDELLIQCCTPEIFYQMRQVVKDKQSNYIDEFDSFFAQNHTTLFNMMFCKRELFDNYCEWLFDILFELEKRVDLSVLNDYQKRLYGFLSERLLNVWVRYNELKTKNVPVVNTETSHREKINILRRRVTNQFIYRIRKKGRPKFSI